MAKLIALKHAIILAVYLLIVWGFYRSLFRLPEEVEELIIKPIVWLLPVFYFVRLEKSNLESIGITSKGFFPGIYLAVGLGALFVAEALFINYLKYGSLSFSANIGDKLLFSSLGIAFATAFSEELTFRGYIFTRIAGALNNEILANFISSLLWSLVHVPITIFIWKLDFQSSVIYLTLTTIFGIGSSFIFARSKNIASSVFLHVLWEWPIALFR